MIAILGLAAQLVVTVPSDTPPPSPRVKAIDVSDWYARRLTLHRRLSYTVIPRLTTTYEPATDRLTIS